jgi:hypothetical protein
MGPFVADFEDGGNTDRQQHAVSNRIVAGSGSARSMRTRLLRK